MGSNAPTRRLDPPRMRLAAGLGAITLALLAGVGTAASSVAAPQAGRVAVNPFEVNGGFTVVAQGDLTLGNGEIEGSVATFGTLRSTVHRHPIGHRVAGTGEYRVPSIDDDPVRILANTFAGTGGIDVANLGASAGTDESRAIAKLADTQGLRATGRSGDAEARIFSPDSTHDEEGYLDLKALPYTEGVIGDRVQTQYDVPAYFEVDGAGVDAQVAQVDQCLATMYDPEAQLVRNVAVQDHGGHVVIDELAEDRPNVISDEAIRTEWGTKTIKLEGAAAGYVPSTQAPLVITVPAGTTSLGQIRVEGWSAQDSAEQHYARYILLDLSDVTGTVSIDGLELGAIWAPRADLAFNSGVSTNGQWFANNVTTAGGGQIHHHDFLGELPCPPPPPELGAFSLTKTVAGEGAELVDDAFTFEVTIDGERHVVELADGESQAFEELPLGTEVTVTEQPATVPVGAVFDGVQLTIDGAPADPGGPAGLTIESEALREVVATNTFSLEPDPVLTLLASATPGDPADWTLGATAGQDDPVVSGAGDGTASGPVTPEVPYTLTASGPAEYVQDGDWQCTTQQQDGALPALEVLDGTVELPRASEVTCTVTSVTATLTVLNLVTGETDLVPENWELSALPGPGIDQLESVLAPGAEAPGDVNTFLVRPEHGYAIAAQPLAPAPGTSLQVAVERYVGPTPEAPDHGERAHWEVADPAAVSVDRGGHEIYRFVNFVPTPLAMPELGGVGTSTFLATGAAVMAAGLIVGVALHRRRSTRGA